MGSLRIKVDMTKEELENAHFIGSGGGKGTNVLRKTPEEIKKGLENCSDSKNDCCNGCPYDVGEKGNCAICITMVTSDALAYIQHLESRLAQAERERDAMLLALKEVGCGVCKHAPHEDDIYIHNECYDCVRQCNFEWRGVCPENTKEVLSFDDD